MRAVGVAVLTDKVDITNVRQILFELFKDSRAQLSVSHLASAKPDRRLHLVAFVQPFARVLHAIVIVVIIRAWAKLHFLNGDRDLFLLRLVGFLFLLVLKLAEIDDPTNGRLGSSCYLYQIQPFLTSLANGVPNIHHAKLFTVFTDDAHFRHANAIVDSYGRQPAIVWTRAATSKACSYAAPPSL